MVYAMIIGGGRAMIGGFKNLCWGRGGGEFQRGGGGLSISISVGGYGTGHITEHEYESVN